MIVAGLTGSIGMGKSTAAALLRRLGVPVHDADTSVHRLLGPGGRALAAVETAFPGTTGPAGADRGELGRRVFGDAGALKRLEAILHPLVRAEESEFLRRLAARRAPLAVLDVPLLFETHGERRCDAVIVVSAPSYLQRRRVLARPGMTRERFAQILAKQMSDAEKRRRADFVVPSGLGRGVTFRHLAAIVRLLKKRESAYRCKSRRATSRRGRRQHA